ncbi:hypothetical protein D5F11_008500 [Siminovitchia terrae]|uniref:Uncharacterized protein n=1 Tax=Siminovitchia terrae TaxID=1914933 RepID=A0A429X9I9_SIMTE|nr:hypothetical protein [Siminovitchia terrae]RST60095.1 hypothetical protein D5F11_008500 [Siminovitchia terrae]
MKIFYHVVLHATNLFFLFVVGVVTVGAAANPSAGITPTQNSVTGAMIIFLLLLTFANYLFQIIKGGWKALLVGHAIYITVFLLSFFLVFPLILVIIEH